MHGHKAMTSSYPTCTESMGDRETIGEDANGIISFFFISQTYFASQFSSGRGLQDRLSLQDSLRERELVMGTEWAAGRVCAQDGRAQKPR